MLIALALAIAALLAEAPTEPELSRVTSVTVIDAWPDAPIRVVYRCAAAGEFGARCKVVSEDPPGKGYGAAALPEVEADVERHLAFTASRPELRRVAGRDLLWTVVGTKTPMAVPPRR